MTYYKAPDEYLQAAITRVQELGSQITDFHIGSTARTIFEALGAIVSLHSGVAEQLSQDSYLATATGDALDRKASDQQVQRVPAVPSIGTVTITRPAPGAAVSIPAGWAPLQTLPAPGQTPVSVLTTEDAVFAGTDTSITVAATAVDGGKSGDLASGTVLLPLSPVDGFQTNGGYTAGTFTGGVDAETDDELRARVPIEVAGRVKGRKEAFESATLRVPGAVSVNVLQAGDDRGDATLIAANNAEVYWKGNTGSASQVESEVAAAQQSGQNVVAIAATAERCVAALTIYVAAGTDTAAIGALTASTVIATVNAVDVGQTTRASRIIEAVHALGVTSVGVPFTDLRKYTDAPGTSGDIAVRPTRYPNLDPADVTVAVVTL